MDPTLKNKKFDATLLHVGVNDPLNDESQDSVQNFVDNLKQIGLKSAEVKRTLISRMVVNNKLTSAYISSANQRISNMCRDNSYVYIDNNNIPTSSLFRDDLHLLETGKPLPTSTLISENPSETTNSCKRNTESDDECCNESLKELRQKNLNPPIIVQLKINSTRNKFQILERQVCANLDILLITENKLDHSSSGGGILLNIRDDVPSRLSLNSNETESIFAEINFRKKKWLICASYNPQKNNISNHLHHSGKSLDDYIGNFDIFLLGYFNLEFSEPCLNVSIKTLTIILALN